MRTTRAGSCGPTSSPDMSSNNSAPHRPSPLSAQLGSSPVAESTLASFDPSTAPSQTYEQINAAPYSHNRPTAGQRTEQEEEVAELEAYREQALLHKKEVTGHFEPFVGSRVGSPIPDNNGLGWPGMSLLSCSSSCLLGSVPTLTFLRSAH